MARVWYVEVVRIGLIFLNLILMIETVRSLYENFNKLNSKDSNYWKNLGFLGANFVCWSLILFFGFWGALTHNTFMLQAFLVLLIFVNCAVAFLHCSGAIVYSFDSKYVFYLILTEAISVILVVILINCSKTEIQIDPKGIRRR